MSHYKVIEIQFCFHLLYKQYQTLMNDDDDDDTEQAPVHSDELGHWTY